MEEGTRLKHQFEIPLPAKIRLTRRVEDLEAQMISYLSSSDVERDSEDSVIVEAMANGADPNGEEEAPPPQPAAKPRPYGPSWADMVERDEDPQCVFCNFRKFRRIQWICFCGKILNGNHEFSAGSHGVLR